MFGTIIFGQFVFGISTAAQEWQEQCKQVTNWTKIEADVIKIQRCSS